MEFISQFSFVTFSRMKYNAIINQSILITGVQPMVHFSAPTPLALGNHVQAVLPSTEAPAKQMTGKKRKEIL